MKPWLTDTFKLSEDPQFVDKVRDVVGLYMNPPEHAVVMCVDEKTSIQALDRTQPILPMRPSQVERRTHDYKRNGVTDLFAALNLATGQIVHQTRSQHRAIDFRKFLDTGDVSQGYLLPPDVRDWLPEDHLAWFVLEVVEEVDLSAFYAPRRLDGRGGAAYDPAILLAVIV